VRLTISRLPGPVNDDGALKETHMTTTARTARRAAGAVVAAGVLAALVGCGQSDPATSPSTTPSHDVLATTAPAHDELLAAANQALAALGAQDYAALAQLASPEERVLFSPYVSIDDAAVRLSPEQIAALGTSTQVLTWGTYDGSGNPITMTFAEYRTQFVWPRDYTTGAQTVVDASLVTGSRIANTAEFFGPGVHWVEYSFPISGPDEVDWSALRLVLRDTDDGYKLIGIVHDAWTP